MARDAVVAIGMTAWALAMAGALLGAIVGSFVGAMLVRWADGRSVAAGRSRCDGCGRTLGPLELVPLLSFPLLRGRCRTCRAAIDPVQWAAETTCAAIGAVAVLAGWPEPASMLALAVMGWLLAALALFDLRAFWLPDPLTLLLALTGIGAALAGIGAPLADRLIGGVAGYGLLMAVALGYRRLRGREGLGGGDPKLFGAIGLWLGWLPLPWVMLGASGLGIVLLIVAMAGGRQVDAATRLPLGTLMAPPAFAIACAQQLL